jgi:hypothetical protein
MTSLLENSESVGHLFKNLEKIFREFSSSKKKTMHPSNTNTNTSISISISISIRILMSQKAESSFAVLGWKSQIGRIQLLPKGNPEPWRARGLGAERSKPGTSNCKP